MKGRKFLQYVLCLLILAGIAVVVRPFVLCGVTDQFVRASAIAFSREEYRESLYAAAQALTVEPSDRRANIIAGLAAAKLRDSETSLRYLYRLGSIEDSRVSVELGKQFMRMGHLMNASISGKFQTNDIKEIPTKYRAVDTTTEALEVKEGSNDFNIDLKMMPPTKLGVIRNC